MVVAGAPTATIGGHQAQGAAYVVARPGPGWHGAFRLVRLIAADGSAEDKFGISVALSGDGSTVVIGAQNATVMGRRDAGAAYVFVRPAGGWRRSGTQYPVAKLSAPHGTAGALLGTSVAISGDGQTVVAGASGTTVGGDPQRGAAYVFARPVGGWAAHHRLQRQVAELTASDGVQSDFLGWAVALSGDGSTVVAGAPFAGGPLIGGQGAVYVFVRAAGHWSTETQTAKLSASNGVPGDALGVSVAVSGAGSTVAAGACCATVNGHYGQGAAYVFTRGREGWVTGDQAGELTASDGARNDSLGSSVAVSRTGTTIVTGAIGARVAGRADEGALYVFQSGPAGWGDTTQAAKLRAAGGAAHDLVGSSVALVGGRLIAAGAAGARVAGVPGQGAIYLLARHA